MEKEIELDEINIILKIPKDTVMLNVRAKVINEDGELLNVNKTVRLDDIMQCRKDFLDNVEDGDDYDVRYIITEKGLETLKNMIAEEEL